MDKVRIIPLGGIGEVGKNMTAIEYDDEIVVVDCGSIFPHQDMLGIDLVIPDITYLERNKERVKGYLITHGHEDHIGAIPYVLPRVPAPIYGTRLTCALIKGKLEEHNIENYVLQVVKPSQTIQVGCFTVQFIHVSHSISGAVAMAITCEAGTIIMSGDFKIDYTPIDGNITDLNTFAAYGSKKVLALLAESTNVERPGYTMSEQKIIESLGNFFREAKGRIIIAMFASNLHRIQAIIDYCIQYRRRICFVGRSMVNVSKMALQLGELKIPAELFVEVADLDCYEDHEILIMTTGSQGEPMSGLTRMANSEHRKLQIREGDMVIISATPIPGNEIMVSRIIDQLYRCGANVVYNRIADVHVSGHACQEELKLLHALTKPRYFIPIHGEYRMLKQHINLACSMGMPEDRAILVEPGQALELSWNEASIAGPIPTGSVMVDGLGVGDVGSVVLRDRKHLSQDGLIIVVVGVSKETGKISSGPELISRGFVYVRENEEIINGAKAVVQGVLDRFETITQAEWTPIKNGIKDEMHEFLFSQLKRNPMILPIIMET